MKNGKLTRETKLHLQGMAIVLDVDVCARVHCDRQCEPNCPMIAVAKAHQDFITELERVSTINYDE